MILEMRSLLGATTSPADMDEGAPSPADMDKQQDESGDQVDVLEKGGIFFFYRPKVETEHPKSIDDVQKMYLVLRPEWGKSIEELKQGHESGKESMMKHKEDIKGGEKKAKGGKRKRKRGKKEVVVVVKQVDKKGAGGGEGEEKVNIEEQQLYRFVVLGHKSLPDASKRTRPYWGFVELVTSNINDIKKSLGPVEYETSTMGKRHQPAARPVGEGTFCLLLHTKGSQTHTHLVYKLELPGPSKEHKPQEELNIEDEGSYIIQVKNPKQSTPRNVGIGKKRKAKYPTALQSRMGRYRFVSADPCDYLNYEGCEFILISASDDIEKELGLNLDVRHDDSCSALLGLYGKKEASNIKPLMEGEWA